MGSALEAVLALKQQQAVAEQQRSDNLTQGLQMLQNAKQQAIQNNLAQMQYKAGLAEKGLVPDSTSSSGFKRDTSLMSPADLFVQQGAIADANNKIMAAGGKGVNLFGSSGGNATIPQSPIGGAIGQVINQPGSTAPTDPNQGVVSGQTLNVAGVPTSTTIDYPQADAAKVSATDLAKEKSQANIGSARDTAQLQMIAQGIKNMNEIHSTLSDKGAAGNSTANFLANNYQHIPDKNIQNKFVSPENQKLIGKFTSARNETLVKVQPILSQQFGQAGTSRIMDSLLTLSKGEFGDLSTPHSQFEGQAEGTLGSLFRIKIASDKYLEELNKTGQPIPKDEKIVTQGIYSKMADLTPEQDKQLKSLVNSTLGKSDKQSNKPNPSSQYSEGQTATNSRTGQKLTYRNGKWQ